LEVGYELDRSLLSQHVDACIVSRDVPGSAPILQQGEEN